MKRNRTRKNLIVTALIALAFIGATNLLYARVAKAQDLNLDDLSLISNVDNCGLASHNEIRREIRRAEGKSPALIWKGLNLKRTFGDGKYALTKILTHITNNADRDEVLFADTLPEINQPESVTTEYTSPINIVEQSMSTSLVIPRLFEGDKGFVKNAAIPDAQVVYNFFLKPEPLVPISDFRIPEGTYNLTTVTPAAFNPIAWLMSHAKIAKVTVAPAATANVPAAAADVPPIAAVAPTVVAPKAAAFIGPMQPSPAANAPTPAPTNAPTKSATFTWLNGTSLENTTVKARQPNNDELTFDITTQPSDAPSTSQVVLIYQKL